MAKQFNENLEALRGFCALVVVLHHSVLFSKDLGSQYSLHKIIGGYSFPGHTMVLIFFILSGYVIGINYYGKDNFSVIEYVKKRLLRLYPMYILVILVTALVFGEEKITVLGNLLFMQNIATPNLAYNGVMWSLNHEIIYYILIIPVLFYKIPIKYVCLLMIILSFTLLYISRFPSIAEGYLIGFLFWLTGFQLSIYFVKNRFVTPEVSVNKFLSVLLLLLASDGLNIMTGFFKIIPKHETVSRFPLDDLVAFSDLAVYVISAYAIVFMVDVRLRKVVGVLAYAMCFLSIVELLVNGSFLSNKFFYLPLLFLCISLFLLVYKRPIVASVRPLIYIGGISYGIYIVHMPILFLIGRISAFDTTLISFGVRCGALLLAATIMAYLLEKIFQPKVKAFFASK